VTAVDRRNKEMILTLSEFIKIIFQRQWDKKKKITWIIIIIFLNLLKCILPSLFYTCVFNIGTLY